MTAAYVEDGVVAEGHPRHGATRVAQVEEDVDEDFDADFDDDFDDETAGEGGGARGGVKKKSALSYDALSRRRTSDVGASVPAARRFGIGGGLAGGIARTGSVPAKRAVVGSAMGGGSSDSDDGGDDDGSSSDENDF